MCQKSIIVWRYYAITNDGRWGARDTYIYYDYITANYFFYLQLVAHGNAYIMLILGAQHT